MTSPPPATKPARRPLWRRVLALFSGSVASILLGLLAIGLGYTQTEHFRVRAGYLVSRVLEHQTGEAASVGELRVDLLGAAIELLDVQLHHPATGDAILTLERLRAPLVIGRRGPGIGTLTLDRPVVQLHLEADGRLREFRNLPAPSGRPLRRLPWWSLALNDGAVSVTHSRGTVELTDLTLQPVDGPLTDISGSLAIHAERLEESTSFRWERVQIGPEAIFAPKVELATHAVAIEGAAMVPLGGELDLRLTVRPNFEELNRLLTPPLAIYGDYDADLHVHGTAPAIQADLVIAGRNIAVDVPGQTVAFNHYRFGDAVLPLHAEGDTLRLDQGRVDWGDGRVWLNGEVNKDLSVPRLNLVGEELSLAAILQQLGSAPTPWIDLRGDVELELTGTAKPLNLVGSFDLATRNLVVKGGPVATTPGPPILALRHAHAGGQLRLDAKHVVLAVPTLRSGSTRGRGTVDVGLAAGGPLDLNLDFYQADLADFGPLGSARLQGTGAIGGRIQGRFNELRLTGHGSLDNFSATGIPYADHLEADLESDMKRLTLLNAQAQRGRTHYHGMWSMDFKRWWMDTELQLDSGRIQDVLGMFLDVDLAHGSLGGRLALHGPLYELDGEASLRSEGVEFLGERFHTASARGVMRRGRFTLDELEVLRGDGGEGLIVRGTVGAGWAMNMDLLADGFELGRLDNLAEVGLPLMGQAWLSATVGGTLFSPEPRGRAGLHHAAVGQTPLADSMLHFSTKEGVLAWTLRGLGDAVQARGDVDLWTDHAWTVQSDLVEVPLHALYPYAADGHPVRAQASGVLQARGSDERDLELTLDLSSSLLRWRHHQLAQMGRAQLTMRDGGWALDRLHLRGGLTDAQLQINAPAGIIALEGGGTLDLDLARAFVPGLVRSDGSADVTLVARGRGANLDTLIDATVHADLLEHESFPAQLEDTTAQILATRDKYNILSAEGELGGGLFEGHGRVDAEDWMPERFALEAHARDAQVQWLETLPPAIGDADIRFDGPTEKLLLSGDVQIREMIFSDRIDWEDWLVEFRDDLLVSGPPVDEEGLFNLNVHIVGDETVQLRNNVVEGVASVDLRVVGDTAKPGLTGWARSKNAVTTLQDREFTMERANVRWNDPWSWDPILDLELLTDLASRDQTYRVSYLVRGPLSGWSTETRSEPALSQADINALLWFGVTADDLEGSGQLYTAIGQAAADMVLTDLFVSGQVQGADEVNQLVDRVDITTGVTSRGEFSPDPHLVVERRFPELGDTRATYEWNMTRRDDWMLRLDNRLTSDFTLSAWYASQSRGTNAGNAGALGVDARIRREWE